MAIVKHNEGLENKEGDWSSTTGTADNGTSTAKPGMGRWQQLGLFLSLTGGGVIIGALAALSVIFLMAPHVKMMDMATIVTNPKYLGLSRTVQVVSTLCMFLIPPVVFAWLSQKNPVAYLGLGFRFSWRQAFLVVFIAVSAIFVGGTLADLNDAIPIPKQTREKFKAAEERYTEEVTALAKMKDPIDLLIVLTVVAMIPAIVEELFFRGALQQLTTLLFGSPWAGILVTSIVFSAIHFSYFGFLTRASLGIVLGLIFYYGKSIWLNVFAHFLNNAIAVVSLYVYRDKPTKEVLEDHFPVWLGLSSLLVLVALLYEFRNQAPARTKADAVSIINQPS